MKPSVIVLCAAALGALSLALAAPPAAAAKATAKTKAAAQAAAKAGPPRLDVKPGEELTIPIAIVDGKVVAGVPRVAKLGASSLRTARSRSASSARRGRSTIRSP